MDGGAWWAIVLGVAKSRTRLSDFTSLSKGWPFPEVFCKMEDPFYFTSSLPFPVYAAF